MGIILAMKIECQNPKGNDQDSNPTNAKDAISHSVGSVKRFQFDMSVANIACNGCHALLKMT